MDFDKEPTLKEFIDAFIKYADEVGHMSQNHDGTLYSHHKMLGGVRLQVVNEDVYDDYEIVGLDLDYLMGCSCPSDVVIKIKKV